MDRDQDPLPEELARWLLAQPQGRATLRWFADLCGWSTDVFNKQTSEMAYAAGRRSIFCDLVTHLREADPIQFSKLIGELL